MNQKGSVFTSLLFFLMFAGFGLFVFVATYGMVFQIHEINGQSMYPNYKNSQTYLINKSAYLFSSIKRGDVVLFTSPKNKSIQYVKRIIAVPGERVSIIDGKVYVESLQLDESAYLEDFAFTFPGGFLNYGEVITVPNNEYFVLGDNRVHSLDSREFGFIPKNLILGKAMYCLSRCGAD